jgi:hypothetical protein
MVGILLLVGCGTKDPFDRVVVAGKVSYQGTPVEFGIIRFTPTEETMTPPNAAYIMHGEYRVEARGGVPAGTHKVVIQAFTGGVPQPTNNDQARGIEDDPAPGPGGPPKQFLPEKYNDKSTLTLEVKTTDEPELTKDWDLE